MINQLLGVSSESEIDQMARFFSDFVDGCLSIPINFPGSTYHTAMKVILIPFSEILGSAVNLHFIDTKLGDKNVVSFFQNAWCLKTVFLFSNSGKEENYKQDKEDNR